MTEKAVNLIESENKLTFIVNPQANKYTVKQTIEALYNVKVEKVNLVITSKGLKKAFVKLTSENQASDLAIRLGIF
jgi:large subunit ribosomal protein L23